MFILVLMCLIVTLFLVLSPLLHIISPLIRDVHFPELSQSLQEFGKAIKLLGACEGNALGKAFTELGVKSETLSIKLQKEVCYNYFSINYTCRHRSV